jgi:hypothetical protein
MDDFTGSYDHVFAFHPKSCSELSHMLEYKLGKSSNVNEGQRACGKDTQLVLTLVKKPHHRH